MIDQKGEKRTNEVSPGGTEDRENFLTCLYVAQDDPISPTIISKCLSGMGFIVTKMSKISSAKQLCKSTHYSLLVLEDCHDKKFIKDIKGPETCNEHTPVMYISSNGKLPDLAKDLTQEQYIDEVVFRCSTMEGDLTRAVYRLTAEPGQFAVTSTKCKRPPAAKKRKVDKASPAVESPLGFSNKGANEEPNSSLAIQDRADSPKTPVETLGCFPLSQASVPPISSLSYTPDLNAGHYTDLNNSAQVLYQPSVYESLGLQPLALNAANMAGRVWHGPMCEQHSFMYPGSYEHALQSYYQGIRAYSQRNDTAVQVTGASPSADNNTVLCPHSSTGGPQSYYQGIRAYSQRNDTAVQVTGASPSAENNTAYGPHSSTGGPQSYYQGIRAYSQRNDTAVQVTGASPSAENNTAYGPHSSTGGPQSYYQGIRAYSQRNDTAAQVTGASPSADNNTAYGPHSSTGGPVNTTKQSDGQPVSIASAVQASSGLLDDDGPNFKLKIDSLDDQGAMLDGGLQEGKAIAANSAKLAIADAPMDLSVTTKERQEQYQGPKNAERATEEKAASRKSLTCAKKTIESKIKISAQGVYAQTSSGDRSKEHHLEKERDRRVRITKCWHWLRAMVPHCSEHADKATVFEMTVAYLHHCWKHHGNLLDQINKDFEKVIGSAGTPEDLENMVSKSVAMERDIVQNLKNGLLNKERLQRL